MSELYLHPSTAQGALSSPEAFAFQQALQRRVVGADPAVSVDFVSHDQMVNFFGPKGIVK